MASYGSEYDDVMDDEPSQPAVRSRRPASTAQTSTQPGAARARRVPVTASNPSMDRGAKSQNQAVKEWVAAVRSGSGDNSDDENDSDMSDDELMEDEKAHDNDEEVEEHKSSCKDDDYTSSGMKEVNKFQVKKRKFSDFDGKLLAADTSLQKTHRAELVQLGVLR